MNSSIHRVTSIKIDPDYLPDKRYQLVKVTVQSDDIEYELNLFTKDAMKIPVEFNRGAKKNYILGTPDQHTLQERVTEK